MTILNIMNHSSGDQWTSIIGIIVAGCATTKQVSKTPKDFSGFLGAYIFVALASRDLARQ
jgi:hypothetical protein